MAMCCVGLSQPSSGNFAPSNDFLSMRDARTAVDCRVRARAGLEAERGRDRVAAHGRPGADQ
jgi:hypothetical protein